jgi:phospholipase C
VANLNKIEHFVVLMLENRSFDHMFGFRPGVDGLKGDETGTIDGYKPIKVSDDAPFELSTKRALGPLHNIVDVNLQLFGSMKNPSGQRVQPWPDGFLESYLGGFTHDVGRPPTQDELAWIMQCFAPNALPAITALADNFVLCDRWFCEVPGPTHPNRLYVHAGTSAGYGHNVFKLPLSMLTIYELLQNNGQTWATYAFDDNEVLKFTRIQQYVDNFRHFDPQFQQDCDTGALPNYSFIEPRFNSSLRHPSNAQHAPHDVRYGDLLISEVYGALRGNPDIWEKCALIVTYDEHGGFPDHVTPPAAPNPDGINSPRADDHGRTAAGALPVFDFSRLGVRVPTLIASPWVEGGRVLNDELRHTSILKTVRERFGIINSLSKREETAASFADVFNQKKARTDCPEHLPRVVVPLSLPEDHPSNPGNTGLDELQTELRDGVVARTRASHPADEDAIWLPKTQAETHEFIRQRLARHREYLRYHPYA